jgi:aminoglycoside phosphotransferase family enzyme/predicted kinase
LSARSHLVEDQSAAIAFLADPRSHGGAAVERYDTHGAVVVLAGERAYKLKRAVRFPYMDFSTLALRRRACEAELRLNRRTAPSLYLAVEPIVRHPSGELALGGEGETVDWVVAMRRFASEALFDRMAERGALAPALVRELADAVLRLHGAAEVVRGQGGAAGIARVIEGNDRGLAEAKPGRVDQGARAALKERSAATLARLGPLLEARREGGLVRQCHGDLHLGNVCLFEDRPTIFDAIEFNEQLSCIDVLYDLAFLLMDLEHRGLRALANLALNRYLSEGARAGALGDLAGLAALPLFLACRAGVRAQVAIAVARAQDDGARRARWEAQSGPYLALALRYLDPPSPRLLAIGGLSGTGKTTIARTLAPGLGASPGAVILRSDVLRKHLLGRDALDRLGAEGYGDEITARVYAALRERARQGLAAGQAVIVDAVHAAPAERDAIAAVAREAGVPFDGIWLEATRERLAARLAARRGDASDATPAVLEKQLAYELGALAWRRLDATGAAEEVAARAAATLGLDPPSGAGGGFGYTPGHGSEQ